MSLNGPNDDVVVPNHVNKKDFEIELGVLIGKDCTDVDEASALDCVCLATLR